MARLVALKETTPWCPVINSSYSLALVLALASACSKDQPKDPPKTEAPKPQTADQAGSGDKTVAPGPKSIDGTYELDPSHSSVNFKIKHFDVSYTFGRFNKVTGSFTIDADPAKSKIAIEIDPASVYTADKKRDDHLKSPDFFNVAQYPKATFTSTAIKAVGADYQVTGDLEIHGTKKSVSTTFQLVGSGPHPMVPGQQLVGFIGELAIKRTEFGMSNMIGAAGDDVQLTISIEGAKK